MDFHWKGFREEISFVDLTSFPDDLKLALLDSIFDPMVPHGSGLEFLRLDSFIGSVASCGIINHNGGFNLWIIDIRQDILENAAALGIFESGGVFGLGN
jgi:hypothetical protein